MSLKENLLSDLKQAQKARDSLVVNTIRTLNSEIKNQEIELRRELNEEEILSLIARQIKKRKEAAALFDQGHRSDLSEKERKESAILEKYLPEQVSEEELRRRIQEVIAQVQAQSPKDLGKIMKILVPEFKGRADNEKIKALVTESLNS